jgi:hypothetical protein
VLRCSGLSNARFPFFLETTRGQQGHIFRALNLRAGTREARTIRVHRRLPEKEKQKRHNNFRFVAKNPQPWQQESVFVPEGNFDFPALPVNKSQLIVVARVGETSAHLSEHKMNVYSEFSVVVMTVLKTSRKEVTENSVLTIERLGGYVKYPNGQKILFRISGWNMPKVGSEYLFFLNSRNMIDWEIVTAYEITDAGVLPLDESSQFEAIKGTSSANILKQVRGLISEQSSK